MADPTPEQRVAEELAREVWVGYTDEAGDDDGNYGVVDSDGRRTLTDAETALAAIASDPAVQDAVLAALVEGGRMVEEPDVYCLCGHHVAEHASDGCRWQWSSVRCACTILRPHRVRLVEPEWREVPNA